MRSLHYVFLIILLPCLASGQSLSDTAYSPISQAELVPDQPLHAKNEQPVITGPGAEIVVLPEVSQVVELSSTAYNRFQCDEAIQDVLASEEKILNVQYEGNNAFIKFKYIVRGGKPIYAEKPIELSIVCGGEIYSMIAVPRPLRSSPKIRLSSGKKKQVLQNASLFGGMPHEKKVMQFIRLVYTDKIPDSFDISQAHMKFELFKGMGIQLNRVVSVPGEGLQLKEYQVSNETKDILRLTEKNFLIPELTTRTVAISMSRLNLKPGETSRLFIVEQTGGNRD